MVMDRESRWRRVELADMIGVGCGRPIAWREEDLADIFSHQLRTPLVCDLPLSVRDLLDAGLIDERGSTGSAMTYRALLLDGSPPLALLRAVKDFAKAADAKSEASMPAEIATAFYYLSIAVALCRHRARITSLSDAELNEGLAWVAQQAWVNPSLQELCHEALAAVAGHGI